MTAQPADPFTALSEGMAQMHEMFASMRKAGFSERQALELTKEMMRAGMEQGQRECPHCGKPMNG
jgi:hypothetical protein